MVRREPQKALGATRFDDPPADPNEQALRDTKARLHAILTTEIDAIIVIDETGAIESANPALARVFGYDPEEVVGKNVSVLMPPPYAEEHDGYIRNYLLSGDPKVIGTGRNVEGRRKDGTVFPMSLSVSEMLIGRRRMFTGIVRDISQRKSAETRSEAFGRIIEESLNEIYVFDEETLRFLEVNHGARVNLGYTLDELRKLTPIDLKPEFTLQSFQELLSPLRSGEKKSAVFETIHRRSDGTHYSVEVHLQHTTFVDDRPVFVAIIVDITERKALTKKLLHQESLAKLGEMSAIVAHEVKNPLAGIISGLRLLQRRMDEGSFERDVIDETISRTLSLSEGVKDILTYSRPRTPNKIATPARIIFDDLIALVARDAGFDGVEIELDCDASATCCCDAELLRPVFLNVFHNAAQAMEGKGKIHVEVRCPGDQCRITVTDTGPGIPTDRLARIFEPFFTTKGGGTGLGLPIAKRVVELHEGEISIDCPCSGGTRVVIELPVS